MKKSGQRALQQAETQLLEGAKSSTGQPQTAEVAEAAYQAWERDGRPEGCDQKYWFEAESNLRGSAAAN